RSELDGIGKKIPGNLLHPVRIAATRCASRLQPSDDFDPLSLCGRTHNVQGSLDHGNQIELADVEAELASDYARDVENVLDQLHLGFGIPMNGFDRGLCGFVVERSLTQEMKPAEH